MVIRYLLAGAEQVVPAKQIDDLRSLLDALEQPFSPYELTPI